MSELTCPKCNDTITSVHKHDFKTCKCGGLSLDGGDDYMRVCASQEIMDELKDQFDTSLEED